MVNGTTTEQKGNILTLTEQLATGEGSSSAEVTTQATFVTCVFGVCKAQCFSCWLLFHFPPECFCSSFLFVVFIFYGGWQMVVTHNCHLLQ